MKRLKIYLINGIFFTLIFGTLFHFLYEWSNYNTIIGFFMPVNESIWEHMKLVFFPMLLYSLIIIPRLKNSWPCIISSMSAGTLLCTVLIPVIFYTATGIIGKHSFLLDIVTFVLSILIAFYTTYRLTLSCRIERYSFLLYALICIFLIGFVRFSYHPPDIGLFADPPSIIK